MAQDGGHWGRGDPAWVAAGSLALAVANAEPLSQQSSPVLLERGEVLHAQTEAQAWRHHALDVYYHRRQVVPIGGLILGGVLWAASTIGSRRCRKDAEQLAASQWRPLGRLPLLATSHRLLLLHEGAWASVWYGAIRQLRPMLAVDRLELVFEDDPPYALEGPWIAYVAVVLATVLGKEAGPEAVTSALLPAHERPTTESWVTG